MNVPTLSETGKRIGVLDQALVRLLAKRIRLAQDVGVRKQLDDDPIFRAQVEDRRIEKVREVAREEGINPHFIHQLLYAIIGESCKIQMAEVQSSDKRRLQLEDPATRDGVLLNNLLELTQNVAETYRRSGGDSYPATDMYVRFENEHIENQVKARAAHKDWHKSTSLALDLGCGTGRVSRLLAPHFGQVIGYDISDYMTTEASNRADVAHEDYSNLSFERSDLSEGIPHADQSVDLVVAGLGTASDIQDGQAFVNEVKRVLKPGGRFVLSFYNREALVYANDFVSIDPSLKAEIDVDEDWLTVYVPGHPGEVEDEPTFVPGTYYQIFARAYTWSEVETMVSVMRQTTQMSYPVTACVIPRTSLAESSEFASYIEKHDRSLSYSTTGAYWLSCGYAD